ncbi:hypothetical protein BKA70DRAFT_564752 [Coprinopsis sp. MPI-PUGE-AT-0042]|nr:hypothetical protein BKA70DRAFT_564752 [Coprinopsis sp. MPI-PUGE-AT-0042]
MDAHRAFLCHLIALRAREHLDGEFHQVLLACSLVCREFRAIALSYVFCFKRVNLTDRRRVQDLYHLTRPISIPAPPPGRPALPNPLQFVRELSISALEDFEDEGYASEDSVWISDEPLLAPLVYDIIAQRAAARERVPLEGFTLHTSRPLEWNQCPKELRSLVFDVILSYPLSEVMFGGIVGLPRDVLLKAMMHTDVLLIEDVSVCRGAPVAAIPRSASIVADPPEMATGLLSKVLSLRELSIVTSPGVIPVLTEWMSESRGLSFVNVKRLALTEIRLRELPEAMSMLQRMAATGCVLEAVELAPLPETRQVTIASLEARGCSFPSELFRDLQCLDITFANVFADPCSITSFQVLRLLFAGMAEENWGGSRKPVLRHLCIRVHQGEDEEVGGMGQLLVSGAGSWAAVAASLGRFAPRLGVVDVGISCESSERLCVDQRAALERQFRQYFSSLSPSVDLVLKIIC